MSQNSDAEYKELVNAYTPVRNPQERFAKENAACLRMRQERLEWLRFKADLMNQSLVRPWMLLRGKSQADRVK